MSSSVPRKGDRGESITARSNTRRVPLLLSAHAENHRYVSLPVEHVAHLRSDSCRACQRKELLDHRTWKGVRVTDFLPGTYLLLDFIPHACTLTNASRTPRWQQDHPQICGERCNVGPWRFAPHNLQVKHMTRFTHQMQLPRIFQKKTSQCPSVQVTWHATHHAHAVLVQLIPRQSFGWKRCSPKKRRNAKS